MKKPITGDRREPVMGGPHFCGGALWCLEEVGFYGLSVLVLQAGSAPFDKDIPVVREVVKCFVRPWMRGCRSNKDRRSASRARASHT